MSEEHNDKNSKWHNRNRKPYQPKIDICINKYTFEQILDAIGPRRKREVISQVDECGSYPGKSRGI
jgi:hypothetical protein